MVRQYFRYRVRAISGPVEAGRPAAGIRRPSTPLSQAAGRALADLLVSPTGAHPWQGWMFSAGWGTQRALNVLLVEPNVVMEVAVDVARDSAGRWRHPVRPHRIRTDVDVAQVPLFGEDDASP